MDLAEVVKGKLTYPTWTTNSKYPLNVESYDKDILVYYHTKSNKKISRKFPKKIDLTPSLCYVFGLLKGEGSNSLGKSNYRRFTITNSDPIVIKLILDEIEKQDLFKKSNLIEKSIHLLHHKKEDKEVITYWSKKLNLPKNKFKCFNDEKKTSDYGVCHVYISDVLLRRVIDIIHEEFFSK